MGDGAPLNAIVKRSWHGIYTHRLYKPDAVYREAELSEPLIEFRIGMTPLRIMIDRLIIQPMVAEGFPKRSPH